MNILQNPSPNFNERDCEIDMLILHYTGMKTGQEALARMCDPEFEVSAHYMVEEDGQVYQLVEEEKRAWHAGVSFWRGHTNINSRSIGIEIVNPGHEWGYQPFPEAQIDSVIQLCKSILSRHPIPARNVVGHSDIAPDRKEDPGELFPWQRLAENGIGLWMNEHSERTTSLEEIGYQNCDEPKTVLAFQRHFTPANMSGQIDEKTKTALFLLGEEIRGK